MLQRDVALSLRRFTLATLMLGMVGIGTELGLIGHVESTQQWIPLVLLALGVVVVAWHSVAPRAVTVRALQGAMLLFVISGGVGVWLHFQGNRAFELEMYPSMTGRELVQKTMTGATPVLAPGSMALLGLIGLTHSYRHPSLQPDAVASRNKEGDS